VSLGGTLASPGIGAPKNNPKPSNPTIGGFLPQDNGGGELGFGGSFGGGFDERAPLTQKRKTGNQFSI